MSKQRKFLKICCASAILVSSLYGKTLVNGISVLVNDEPITLYEIHKMAKQMNISLKEALSTLIEKRLEDSQIKRLGIQADSFEVGQEIEKIAASNGMSSYELMSFVRSKGLSEEEYRGNIAKSIKNQKLFKRIFRKNIPAPSDSQIVAYYEANKAMFMQSSGFEVTAYRASTYTALQEVQQSPMSVVSGVRLTQERILSSQIDKKTSYYLNQTLDGKFTPILKQDDKYVMYLVDRKLNSTTLSLEEAKPIIIKEIGRDYERDVINNYFDKLKADADIEFVRKP